MQPEPQPAPPTSAASPTSTASPAVPTQWEYRVVHINVDPGKPPEPPDPQAASEHLRGTLSPDFLAREFPEVYGEESETARRSRHPAEQLQTFLNLLGRQGWEMTDSSQVGPLLMFFFKRPLRPVPKLIAASQPKSDTRSEVDSGTDSEAARSDAPPGQPT
jgi:hypothetical protein